MSKTQLLYHVVLNKQKCVIRYCITYFIYKYGLTKSE